MPVFEGCKLGFCRNQSDASVFLEDLDLPDQQPSSGNVSSLQFSK